mmetsp:Transcript_25798/g.83315  ORF Transcript_25798/g.83315 Transcript_25798/m.83315 type:complete len:299 (+) Transcript_25798:840-1736(+)
MGGRIRKAEHFPDRDARGGCLRARLWPVHHHSLATLELWLPFEPSLLRAALRSVRWLLKTRSAARLASWPAALARLLLRGHARDAQLPPDGGQPDLSSDPVVGRRGAARRLEGRAHGLPVDRRGDDAAAARRVDSPPSAPRRGVLPHARRLLAELGTRRRGLRGISGGCRRSPELGKLDVAVVLVLLLPVLPLLLARRLPQEVRQGWRLRAPLAAAAREIPVQVHLRALEGTDRGAEEGRLHHRQGLSKAAGVARSRLQGEHGQDEQGLRGTQGGGGRRRRWRWSTDGRSAGLLSIQA